MEDALFTSLTDSEEASFCGGNKPVKAPKSRPIIIIKSTINGSAAINGDASVVGGPGSTNNTTSGGNTITQNGTAPIVGAANGGSNNAIGVSIG